MDKSYHSIRRQRYRCPLLYMERHESVSKLTWVLPSVLAKFSSFHFSAMYYFSSSFFEFCIFSMINLHWSIWQSRMYCILFSLWALNKMILSSFYHINCWNKHKKITWNSFCFVTVFYGKTNVFMFMSSLISYGCRILIDSSALNIRLWRISIAIG